MHSNPTKNAFITANFPAMPSPSSQFQRCGSPAPSSFFAKSAIGRSALLHAHPSGTKTKRNIFHQTSNRSTLLRMMSEPFKILYRGDKRDSRIEQTVLSGTALRYLQTHARATIQDAINASEQVIKDIIGDKPLAENLDDPEIKRLFSNHAIYSRNSPFISFTDQLGVAQYYAGRSLSGVIYIANQNTLNDVFFNSENPVWEEQEHLVAHKIAPPSLITAVDSTSTPSQIAKKIEELSKEH